MMAMRLCGAGAGSVLPLYLLRSQIVRTVNMSCTHGRNQLAWSDRVHSVGLGERVEIAVIFLHKTLIIRTRNTQLDGSNNEIHRSLHVNFVI